MGQASTFLCRATGGYLHWCPGCEEMHCIPDTWSFDGQLNIPTFNPSVKITGKQTVVVNGKWTGEWVRDAAGKPLDYCCHYFLRAGQLLFQGDCTHALKGQTVALPELPAGYRDNQENDRG